ncbi:MAG: TM1266 family iron-only hydrogenase system putative regulator [Treponemataceae bacterium]|nr:iron-only hydrogenase system regulator [Spirochaetales bacterium]MDY6030736.1 TM1266 family iron-only hydrogenase system putative regulator [Treponemataceae bacterium]
MNTSDKAIGTITVLVKDRSESASKVNEIVSQFSNIIIGRLGLPYSDRDLSIITLVVDASTDEIGALTGKIGQISGISVKSSLIRA